MKETKMTKDYNLFKFLECNRNIDESNLRKLINSMSIKYLGELRPITVNTKYEILDGQHRFKAAQSLGLPIYYVIDRTLEKGDIILLNSAQQIWKKEDFLKYYVQSGMEEYIKFQNYMKKCGFLFSIAFQLLNTSRNSKEGDEFKSGKYIFNEEKANRIENKLSDVNVICDFFKEKVTGSFKFINQAIFKHSLLSICCFSDFDLKTFLNKLEYNLHKFRRCSTKGTYLEQWIEIYNWKNKNPLNGDKD